MKMLKSALGIALCHLIGDYVLQTDFIAKSKGDNWYHLLVHCVLYIAPFYIVCGFDWRLFVLFASHVVMDSLKARWRVLDYFLDQTFHYLFAFMLYGR